MSPLRLRRSEIAALPRLAWLARHEAGASAVEVLHGPWVEAGDEFVVEGVWSGPFAEAGFHRHPCFFGSGVRVVDDTLRVVPSRSAVDRVLYVVLDRTLVASNSLPLLLASLGARLDPDANYRVPTNTPIDGIEAYTDEIPVLHPRLAAVRQRLYDPLRWREGELRDEPRPDVPSFSDYADYVGTLRDELGALLRNARSGERSRPLDVFSTLSSGYDSPTVTALAAEHGLEAAFAGTAPRHSLVDALGGFLAPDDSGAEVARHLDVEAEIPGVRRDLGPAEEPFYYAAGALTTELGLAPLCARIAGGPDPAVLLTGYHGDMVWDVELEERYQTTELPTGGCDLSEIRLAAGFVNAPVPALHARAVQDILRISRSPEMEPWRLDDEDYDRPIPRRILEEKGVPREAFGQEKRVLERRERWPRTGPLRREFRRYLRERHGWPTPLARGIAWTKDLVRSLVGVVVEAAGERGIELEAQRLRRALGYVDLRHELHVWAVNHLVDRYGSVPAVRGPTGSEPARASPDGPGGSA